LLSVGPLRSQREVTQVEAHGLDGLGIFVRVAEARSFMAAAIALGVTPSAISHTIRQL
jgi:Bacterial regulatory helix-turn-helix protein, lysR family